MLTELKTVKKIKIRNMRFKYRFLTFVFIISLFGYFYNFQHVFYESVLINKRLEHIRIQKLNLNNCSCEPEDIVSIRKTNKFLYVNVETDGKKRRFFKLERKEFPLENVTCDLYNVLRRGPNQKIIGYSLYGSNKGYYKEFKTIIKLIEKYYPDWILRIYYDEIVDKEFICELECLKWDKKHKIYNDRVDLCPIKNLRYGLNEINIWDGSYIHGMKWRWLPLGDPFADIFMSRDSDSWITQREKDSVDVWLKSNTLFHVMRDHPYHGVPILGEFSNLEFHFKLFSS